MCPLPMEYYLLFLMLYFAFDLSIWLGVSLLKPHCLHAASNNLEVENLALNPKKVENHWYSANISHLFSVTLL